MHQNAMLLMYRLVRCFVCSLWLSLGVEFMLAVPGLFLVVPGGLESPLACPRGFTVPCPRGLAANAEASRGGLSLVNTPRGSEHCFQELSYMGVSNFVICTGCAHIKWNSPFFTCALDGGLSPGCSCAAHVNTCD